MTFTSFKAPRITNCLPKVILSLFFLSTLILLSNAESLAMSELDRPFISQDNPIVSYDFSHSSRLLEQEEISNVPQRTSEIKSLSLSIGKVLSSINIDPASVVLSKDNRHAFAMSHYYASLKIIDISNLKSPLVIGSITLKKSLETRFKYGAILLSDDESTLFISNIQNLEIVNVQDLKSPVLLGGVQDKNALFDSYSRAYPEIYKTSIVLSKDQNTLLVAGMGLQTFDISNVASPKLLTSTVTERILPSNYIEAVMDNQILLMADQSFKVYDISDPRNMKLINTFSTKGSTSSFILSKDKRSAFVISRDVLSGLYLEKIDISDPTSIVLLESTNLPLSLVSFKNPVIIAISPCENYVFMMLQRATKTEAMMRVYDRSNKRVQETSRSLVGLASCILFSPDKGILITASDKAFKIIELFTDFPNKRTFSLSANPVQTYLTTGWMNSMTLSQDKTTVFMAGGSVLHGKGSFVILDLSKVIYSKRVSLYESEETFTRVFVTADEKLAYLQGKESFHFLDISNQSAPVFINDFSIEGGKRIQESVMTRDGKMAIFLQSNLYDRVYNTTITILDLSDLLHIKEIWSFSLPWILNDWHLKLSHDERYLFVIQNELIIFDLFDLKAVRKVNSMTLTKIEDQQKIFSSTLSSDDRILFLKIEDESYIFKLRIYDVSDLNSPKYISEVTLPQSVVGCTEDLVLSPDFKRLYLAQLGSLLMIDISNLYSPVILGIHQALSLTSKRIDSFLISPDGNTAYLANFKGELGVISLEIPYTLFIKQESFKLGEKYSTDTVLLRQNSTTGHQPVSKSEYKTLNVFLLNVQAVETENPARLVYSSLPYWTNFDKENLLLNIEPKSEGDLGTYTLCTAFSTKMSIESFSQIEFLSADTDPRELVIMLIGLGYIDNQLFLTPSFGSLEDFLLPKQYASLKEDIHNVLVQFYVETCTRFDINPSLELGYENDRIYVKTPSMSNIKVEIDLDGDDANFVALKDTHVQPVIFDNRLTMEGSRKDINQALKKIVIDFENDDEKKIHDGTITINDRLNPSVVEKITDVKKYFLQNKEPYMNPAKTVQSQIDANQMYTGQYFTITLDEKTFLDFNNQSLTYELTFEDGSVPNWLTLNNLNLRGTPPEEVFGREIPLVITAQNEFKNTTVRFNLHVKISSIFAIKLAARYSPYILTVIGFWIFANKIYNILCKRRYKHPKEFYVQAGREITADMVFPIALIAEEKQECELLLEYLKDSMSKREIRQLIGHFIENRNLNKEKLLRALEESIVSIAESEKRKFNLYLSEDEKDRSSVTQLIINQMVKWQINLKEEEKTLECFNKMKEIWTEIIEFDASIKRYIINEQKLAESLLVNSENENPNEAKLLFKNDINMELLKDVILGYVFEKQSLEISAIKIQISGRQKTSENFIKRLFKLNLEKIDFSDKGKLGYGLSYEINNETLYFLGTPEKRFKGKTMVVQITDKKQKILKEISIHGISSRKHDSSMNTSTMSFKSNYEIL